MTRLLVSFSLICLLVFSNGWNWTIHFCMNRVEDVSLFAAQEHHCSFCGMDQEQSSGCCHQEKQLVKLVQDQRPPQFIRYLIAPATDFALPVQHFVAYFMSWETEGIHRSVEDISEHSRPPLYMTNRVFRI